MNKQKAWPKLVIAISAANTITTGLSIRMLAYPNFIGFVKYIIPYNNPSGAAGVINWNFQKGACSVAAKEEEGPVDLVFSYIVKGAGAEEATRKDLDKALADGYRIIDVITSTPAPAAASQLTFVVVTVVLSKGKSSLAIPYLGFAPTK